mmetsp:Transcript_3603/g.9348  ORF Transcript_3603/g.9348 Transcript_3603/m.9348 type:complete len:227 (+) Transcript_3603:768-1448(+)
MHARRSRWTTASRRASRGTTSMTHARSSICRRRPTRRPARRRARRQAHRHPSARVCSSLATSAATSTGPWRHRCVTRRTARLSSRKRRGGRSSPPTFRGARRRRTATAATAMRHPSERSASTASTSTGRAITRPSCRRRRCWCPTRAADGLSPRWRRRQRSARPPRLLRGRCRSSPSRRQAASASRARTSMSRRPLRPDTTSTRVQTSRSHSKTSSTGRAWSSHSA